ncbi:SAM-dependent methyltransferase [Tistrella bauzanensis]|uniref:class I SAM-dependent methyltransferase n=1 Tax=Tistrella TaxID=171436 RepID=UPI0031F5FA74
MATAGDPVPPPSDATGTPLPADTPVGRIIAGRIAHDGPMTVGSYMALALGHPVHGYYTAREPFGAGGDFVTAPEISQMFGELVGLWLAVAWDEAGRPARPLLVELGPGRGTLMADSLRAMRMLPGLLDMADVHLVEQSPRLKAAQAAMLSQCGLPRPVTWHDDIDDLPADRPVLLIANEFFDALPVQQLVRRPDGLWSERMIDLDPDRPGHFRYGLSPDPSPMAQVLTQRIAGAPLAAVPPGSLAEVQPAAIAIAGRVAARIAANGGAALIVDYGHGLSAPGDTFQAMRAHAHTDPLIGPGLADLTVHVDFERLAAAATAAGATAHGPVGQGRFLGRLGIGARAERLARAAPDGTARAAIATALRRLTAPDQMGTLFKVLALTRATTPPPGFAPVPGFDDA